MKPSKIALYPAIHLLSIWFDFPLILGSINQQKRLFIMHRFQSHAFQAPEDKLKADNNRMNSLRSEFSHQEYTPT